MTDPNKTYTNRTSRPILIARALDLALQLGASALANIDRTVVTGALLDADDWMNVGASREVAAEDLGGSDYRAITKTDWLAGIALLESAQPHPLPSVAAEHITDERLITLVGDPSRTALVPTAFRVAREVLAGNWSPTAHDTQMFARALVAIANTKAV